MTLTIKDITNTDRDEYEKMESQNLANKGRFINGIKKSNPSVCISEYVNVFLYIKICPITVYNGLYILYYSLFLSMGCESLILIYKFRVYDTLNSKT